jgi:hypothetical protein
MAKYRDWTGQLKDANIEQLTWAAAEKQPARGS